MSFHNEKKAYGTAYRCAGELKTTLLEGLVCFCAVWCSACMLTLHSCNFGYFLTEWCDVSCSFLLNWRGSTCNIPGVPDSHTKTSFLHRLYVGRNELQYIFTDNVVQVGSHATISSSTRCVLEWMVYTGALRMKGEGDTTECGCVFHRHRNVDRQMPALAQNQPCLQRQSLTNERFILRSIMIMVAIDSAWHGLCSG